MGVCLSKKKKKQHSLELIQTSPSPTSPPPADPSRSPPHPVAAAVPKTVTGAEEKKPPVQEATDSAPAQNPIKPHHQRKVSTSDDPTSTASGSASRERKPVFLVTPAKQRRPSRPPSPDPQSSASERESARQQQEPSADTPTQQLSQSSVGGGAGHLPVPSGHADGQHLARRRDGGLLPEAVRTSSCTKEEVESILIQCGRLSRSESGKAGEGGGRRYSGVKRSYDFDRDAGGEELPVAAAAQLQSSSTSSARPSPRRRAHSRERDAGGEGGAAVKRSNSRERMQAGGTGSRRVSRSPGKRSDNGLQQQTAAAGSAASSSTSNNSNTTTNNNGAVSAAPSGQPGKMVSVPAREKDVVVGAAAPARRGTAIRNSSPRRSRSPATLRHVSAVSNENTAPAGAVHHTQQHPQSLSRNSSRKGASTEHSPFRRNPMAEIDDNVLRGSSDSQTLNPAQKVARTPRKAAASSTLSHQQQAHLSGVPPQHKPHPEFNATCPGPKQQPITTNKTAEEEQLRREAEEALAAAAAASKGPTLTRTRSSRRSSRDLDALPLNTDANNINTNATGGAAASYASLLLEDIHSYHQAQNHNQLQQQAAAAGVTLPACVSKACSILEAVAGLNNNNNNSPAGSWTESNNNNNHNYVNRRGLGVGNSAPRKDGGGFIVESEVAGHDDLMEPSMHRYVSVRDKLTEMEPQESAGSNSFIPAHTWAAGTGSSSGDLESSDRCWTSERSGDAGEEVDGSGVDNREPHGNNCRQQPPASTSRKQQRPGGSLLSNGSGCQLAAGRKREQQQQQPVVELQRQGRVTSGAGIGRFGRATTSSVIVVSASTS